MIKFIKRNKLLSILLLLTIISFILGIFFNALIKPNMKELVESNINNLIKDIVRGNSHLFAFKSILANNFILSFIIWILGISIIGIIIVLFLYLYKVFILGFELISLICNLKLKRLLFILVYMTPKLFNMGILFILVLFSISYSIYLFKLIFLKRNINITYITKRYIKVLGIILLILLLSSIIEAFIIPKLITIVIS